MQAEPGEMADELLRPAYWLAWGLDVEWPDDAEAQECIAVVAPGMVPRDGLSFDAREILAGADVLARKRSERVVFFTDLTRSLTRNGQSWPGLGIDWETALRELKTGHFPVVFLETTARGYLTMCDPAPGQRVEDRRLFRRELARQLEAGWPDYVRGLIEAGRLRLAS